MLAAEDVAAEPGALKLIARAARGSMRDAQSLADQAIAYGGGRIEEAAVRQMLGAVDRSHAVALRRGRGGTRRRRRSSAQSTACASSASPPLARSRKWPRCCSRWRSLQAVPGALADDDPDSRGRAAPRGVACPPTRPSFSTASSCTGRAEIALAPDEYSGLVMVLLRMLAFAPADARATPVAPPPTPLRRTRRNAAPRRRRQWPRLGAGIGRSACAPRWRHADGGDSAGDADSDADRGSADDADDAERRSDGDLDRRPARRPTAGPSWCRRLAASGAIAAMVRELAMQAQCVRIVDGAAGRVWRLRVERENLRTPALRERLQAALAQQADGRPMRIEIEAGAVADTPAARDAAERDRRQAEAERIIHDDPLVKALMAQYKTARIVPGSIKPPPADTLTLAGRQASEIKENTT